MQNYFHSIALFDVSHKAGTRSASRQREPRSTSVASTIPSDLESALAQESGNESEAHSAKPMETEPSSSAAAVLVGDADTKTLSLTVLDSSEDDA